MLTLHWNVSILVDFQRRNTNLIVGFIKYVWVSKLRIFIFGLAKLSI